MPLQIIARRGKQYKILLGAIFIAAQNEAAVFTSTNTTEASQGRITHVKVTHRLITCQEKVG